MYELSNIRLIDTNRKSIQYTGIVLIYVIAEKHKFASIICEEENLEDLQDLGWK